MSEHEQAITEEELKEAERELRASSTELKSSPSMRWTALLDKWQRYEQMRESAKADYDLRAELPQGTKEQAVQQYAQAKRALLGIERHMLELLQGVDEAQRERLLGEAFLFHGPTFTRMVSATEQLRARLRNALQAREKEAPVG